MIAEKSFKIEMNDSELQHWVESELLSSEVAEEPQTETGSDGVERPQDGVERSRAKSGATDTTIKAEFAKLVARVEILEALTQNLQRVIG